MIQQRYNLNKRSIAKNSLKILFLSFFLYILFRFFSIIDYYKILNTVPLL